MRNPNSLAINAKSILNLSICGRSPMNFANRFPTSRRFAAATAKRPIASKMQSASPPPPHPSRESSSLNHIFTCPSDGLCCCTHARRNQLAALNLSGSG
ncbi:hypothetical protein CDAR_259981 [Caerostris darwini]|uniref:Uncharacterized protein n=1 Tax=Caerostris darwini TaxID=1538125 RepID=A0AAV4RDU4_9ARAC|nr:hypothetical protein CDAR_259981 [Caerostris darwini]